MTNPTMIQLPPEILTAIGSVTITILSFLLLHWSKLPFKMVWGKGQQQGSGYITEAYLKANCADRQRALDDSLDKHFKRLYEGQKEIKDLYMQTTISFEGRISRLEGQQRTHAGR
jgi:hypothetical protein